LHFYRELGTRRQLTGIVDIKKDDRLHEKFFQVPACSDFISKIFKGKSLQSQKHKHRYFL